MTSIGRPQEFDTEKALNQAMNQFWENGFDGTSLQDLLDSTGLSKSSLYQAFGGKQELFLRCLDEYADSLKADLLKRLATSNTAIQFLEDVFKSAADEARKTKKPKGCLIMNTVSEFAQSDTEIARHVSTGIGGLKEVFVAAIERAKQEGTVSKKSNSDQLANYLLSSMSGIRSMVKGGMEARSVEEIVFFIMKAVK